MVLHQGISIIPCPLVQTPLRSPCNAWRYSLQMTRYAVHEVVVIRKSSVELILEEGGQILALADQKLSCWHQVGTLILRVLQLNTRFRSGYDSTISKLLKQPLQQALQSGFSICNFVNYSTFNLFRCIQTGHTSGVVKLSTCSFQLLSEVYFTSDPVHYSRRTHSGANLELNI